MADLRFLFATAALACTIGLPRTADLCPAAPHVYCVAPLPGEPLVCGYGRLCGAHPPTLACDPPGDAASFITAHPNWSTKLEVH
jgi:hypothetical protein